MRNLKVIVLIIIAMISAQAWAIDDTPQNRVEQAKRFVSSMPLKEMFIEATERNASHLPEDKRQTYKNAMMKHLDVSKLEKAFEKAAVKAMTADEIKALADFYSALGNITAINQLMKKVDLVMTEVAPAILAEASRANAEVIKEQSKNLKEPQKQPIPPSYTLIEQDRFLVSRDEVYDRKTDRTWKRCNYGQMWDDQSNWCKGVVKRMSVESANSEMKESKGGWRVPDVNELMSLFEVYCGGEKSKVQEIFPEIKREWYATSTPNRDSHIKVVECLGSGPHWFGVGKQLNLIIRPVREGK
jgi:hypothetical protein